MLTTETAAKALELLDQGYTFPSITEQTGITTEDAEAVHVAWFKGTTEQLFRKLQLADVLELAAARPSTSMRSRVACMSSLRRMQRYGDFSLASIT